MGVARPARTVAYGLHEGERAHGPAKIRGDCHVAESLRDRQGIVGAHQDDRNGAILPSQRANDLRGGWIAERVPAPRLGAAQRCHSYNGKNTVAMGPTVPPCVS